MERTTACTHCERGVFEEDAFCSWCGARLQTRTEMTGETRRHLAVKTIATEERELCESCHSVILPGDKFCASCGAYSVSEDPGTGFRETDEALARRITESSDGRYDYLQPLGRGGMGVVLLFRDTSLGRLVAVKVLAPSLLRDDSMVNRFEREARIVASLRHESIVQIYDVGETAHLRYFVMDYIEGATLTQLLRRRGILPLSCVGLILHRIGAALSYAHEPRRGVVHRDVKPSNIMIDRDGQAVVTDFGISKAQGLRSGLTRTGQMMGTAEYMSPEQCRGLAVDAASDQYSLGAVAYTMLTGHPPFSGPQYQVLMAHQQAEPTPIQELRPDCPSRIAEGVHRMLAKVPSERFPSIRDALRSMDLLQVDSEDPGFAELRRLVGVASAERASRPEQESAETIPTPSSIKIVPLPGSLELGERRSLRATVVLPDGAEDSSSAVSWSSTDPQVLRVDESTGVIEAVGTGTGSVRVEARGLTESVSIEVTPPKPARVVVDPSELSMRTGEERTLSAKAFARSGRELGQSFSWSSTARDVVAVDQEGTARAVAPGEALVSANTAQMHASCSITVLEQTQRRSSRRRRRFETPRSAIAGAALVFLAALALLPPVRDGIGSLFGDSGPPAISALVLEGPQGPLGGELMVSLGETVPLTVVQDGGDAESGPNPVWSSSNPDAVGVSDDGVLEARGLGAARVGVSVGNRRRFLQVGVIEGDGGP